MAAPNTEPIFNIAGLAQWITGISTTNNTKDITSGTSYLVFTADATNGSFVKELRVKPDPTTNAADTAMRIFINNGSTTTVAANSSLIGELSLVSAGFATGTGAQPEWVYSLGFALPASYRIYVTIGSATRAQNFSATVIAGKY